MPDGERVAGEGARDRDGDRELPQLAATPSTASRLAAVDSMRVIAILAVIVIHVAPFTHGAPPARGHEEAAHCRADISEEMTAREIAEAQRRARQWLADGRLRAA